MHKYMATIKVMARGSDTPALLRGIEGASRRRNKVFEFSSVRLELATPNANNPALIWYVWEVEKDGVYCLTYVDVDHKKQTMYYQKYGEEVGEISIVEAIKIARGETSDRRTRKRSKRTEQSRLKRRVSRQLTAELAKIVEVKNETSS